MTAPDDAPPAQLPSLMVLPMDNISIADIAVPQPDGTHLTGIKIVTHNAIARAELAVMDSHIPQIIEALQLRLDSRSGITMPPAKKLLGPDGAPL